MPFAELNARTVCELLATAGCAVSPADVVIEAREERWLVRLPGERLAWFAASDEGLRLLRTERRVLRLLERRCRFAAPRVLAEHENGDFDVRAAVPGNSDPWRVYAALREDQELADAIGAAVGAILAEQHSRIAAADVEGWLPRRVSWPEPRQWILARLPAVVDDPQLIADADDVMAAFDAVPVTDGDRALVHGDLGLHNMAIDPRSFVVNGLFDYEGAAWADRHHDFRYLVFDFDGYELLDGALASYRTLVDRPIQRERVLLYNAACALTYLAYRKGTPPEQRSCGRTLAEDLRWSRMAIARLAMPIADLSRF
jgi:aminoglycoside phosphotransferase (APT) family kinase protein